MTSFGSRAAAIIERLGERAQDFVVADPGGIYEALVESYRRRATGQAYTALAVYADETQRALRMASPKLLATSSDHAGRVHQFAAFANRGERDNAHANAFGLFFRVATRIAFRSEKERSRWSGAIGSYAGEIEVLRLEDNRVPVVTIESPDRIVVWAPDIEPLRLGTLLLALSQWRAPVTIISDAGTVGDFAFEVVPVKEAASALRQARLIVDSTIDAPDSAAALARMQVPLVATTCSGVAECLRGVFEYDPLRYESVASALRAAIGAPPPKQCVVAIDETVPVLTPEPPSQPLVSIVIPSYNRRAFLDRALTSLDRQTWQNLEVVVVNDGGAEVADIVGAHPRARLLDFPNSGLPRRNEGIEASHGEFIGVMDDDDIYFPEHVERCVGALQRSGAGVVTTQWLECFVDEDESGAPMAASFHMCHTAGDLRLVLSIQGTFPTLPVMMRRSAIGEQRFNLTFTVGDDFEFWSRLIAEHDFVYVPLVTAVYTAWRSRPSMRIRFAEAIARDYQRIHDKFPVQSPVLKRMREQLIVAVQQPGYTTPKPTLPDFMRLNIFQLEGLPYRP